MNLSWTIIADDLTGAADAVASFGHLHASTVILDVTGPWPDTTVLAVDTESRYLSAAEAAAIVGHAAHRSLGLGRGVFKKIDSLLRGNVGAEVAAALDAMGPDAMALVAPAFPSTGRTMVGGIVHVNGEPHDAGHFNGNIAASLADGALIAASLASSPGRTPQQLAGRLGELRRAGARAVVLDAATDAELQDVARAAELVPFPVLLVGSGGLARFLLPGDEDTTAAVFAGVLPQLRGLSIIGSYSKLSRLQLAALIKDGSRHLVLDHARLDQAPAQLLHALEASDVVLTPDPHAPVDKTRAPAVAGALATAALSVKDRCGVMMVSGGETARAVLDALETSHMHVLGEIEPGVVVNRVPGLAPLFITKAGAFGDAGTMARTLRALSETTTEMSTK